MLRKVRYCLQLGLLRFSKNEPGRRAIALAARALHVRSPGCGHCHSLLIVGAGPSSAARCLALRAARPPYRAARRPIRPLTVPARLAFTTSQREYEFFPIGCFCGEPGGFPRLCSASTDAFEQLRKACLIKKQISDGPSKFLVIQRPSEVPRTS
jgi:hypothetical protein